MNEFIFKQKYLRNFLVSKTNNKYAGNANFQKVKIWELLLCIFSINFILLKKKKFCVAVARVKNSSALAVICKWAEH